LYLCVYENKAADTVQSQQKLQALFTDHNTLILKKAITLVKNENYLALQAATHESSIN